MQLMKMVVPAVMVHRPENKKRRTGTTGKTKGTSDATKLVAIAMLSRRSIVQASHQTGEIDART